MRMGRPNQTHDRLDALLDRRPGEVTDDLAPLLAAAEALRGELAEFELDPEVVDRHLEQVLDRPATVVPLPVGEDRGGLRRRLVAVALAAALVLVPATAASAASGSALPGQPLYPVKLAVEQFRLAAAQWSATAEAHERTRLAAIRLKELEKLVQLRRVRQILPAIRALDKAVVAAHAAVRKAIAEEGADPELVAKLRWVQQTKSNELVALTKIVRELPQANQAAIKLAVQHSEAITASLPVLPPTPATTAAPNSTGPPDTGGPAGSGPTPTTAPPPTPTTAPPPPTTAPPPPTTAPTTTEAPATTETPLTTAAGSQESPAGAGSEETPTSSTTLN
jgi:hypothetical protein